MDLFKYQDLKYKEFNEKIINQNVYPTIGIRIPELRKIAKEVAKNDYKEYIQTEHKYYEEYMIHGLVIGYAKIDFDSKIKMLDNYVPYLNDWSLTDIVASNLKDFKNNQEVGFKYILKLISGSTFTIRFGIVLLLNYYLNDEYIDEVINIIMNISNNDYYVMMAKAWILSYVYIKYPSKGIKILKSNKLPIDVHNKTISKICDSYKVNIKDKEIVKKMRRKV